MRLMSLQQGRSFTGHSAHLFTSRRQFTCSSRRRYSGVACSAFTFNGKSALITGVHYFDPTEGSLDKPRAATALMPPIEVKASSHPDTLCVQEPTPALVLKQPNRSHPRGTPRCWHAETSIKGGPRGTRSSELKTSGKLYFSHMAEA